eukprot:4334661-Ditylum_brightwellii.AAC.1
MDGFFSKALEHYMWDSNIPKCLSMEIFRRKESYTKDKPEENAFNDGGLMVSAFDPLNDSGTDIN